MSSEDKFIEKYFDPDNEDGFNEVIFQRNEKKIGLKKRLKKYIKGKLKILLNGRTAENPILLPVPRNSRRADCSG